MAKPELILLEKRGRPQRGRREARGMRAWLGWGAGPREGRRPLGECCSWLSVSPASALVKKREVMALLTPAVFSSLESLPAPDLVGFKLEESPCQMLTREQTAGQSRRVG